MAGLGSHQAESMGSQHQDHFRDLERQRDRKESVRATHTSRSQARGKSHVSQEENARNMQREIDHLKRSLRHERRKRAPSNPNFSSRGEEDDSYRRRSRAPPSESFSYDRDYHHKRKDRKLPSVSLGNDAVSKALNQISRLPFTCWIEEGRLP